MSAITTYQSGVAQSSAYRNLNKLFSTLLKEHGLTSMQWFVLGTIYDSGAEGIQMTLLSAKLQTGLPFITNTINLLESKGMVTRKGSLTDSRSKYVSIADEFKKECEDIEKDLRERLRASIYADISPEDLAIYLKVLYKLSQIKIVDDTVTSDDAVPSDDTVTSDDAVPADDTTPTDAASAAPDA